MANMEDVKPQNMLWIALDRIWRMKAPERVRCHVAHVALSIVLRRLAFTHRMVWDLIEFACGVGSFAGGNTWITEAGENLWFLVRYLVHMDLCCVSLCRMVRPAQGTRTCSIPRCCFTVKKPVLWVTSPICDPAIAQEEETGLDMELVDRQKAIFNARASCPVHPGDGHTLKLLVGPSYFTW